MSSCKGMSKWDLDTPALVLDLDILQANINKMAAFFNGKAAKLRPHSKTHKCAHVAKMQIAAGAKGITCAKLGEAEALAESTNDILIANQIVGGSKIKRLMDLRKKVDVMVAADDAGNIAELSQAAQAAGVNLRILIEVNTGMNRCGFDTAPEALALAKLVDNSANLTFAGLQGYEGHTVMIPDAAERRAATEKALTHLTQVKAYIEANSLPVGIVSGGGTGTYKITGSFPGMDEIQAGSYATMDGRYRGIVPEFDCALTVLSTVISRPKPGLAISDTGMKSLSHEFGLPPVVSQNNLQLRSLSEEHGILEGSGADALKIGDKVELVPSHGCTTINLHDRYYVVQNEKVVDVWPIDARGRSQ